MDDDRFLSSASRVEELPARRSKLRGEILQLGFSGTSSSRVPSDDVKQIKGTEGRSPDFCKLVRKSGP